MWLGGQMAGWITLGIMQAQPNLARAWQNVKGIFSKIESTHKMKKGKINRMLKKNLIQKDTNSQPFLKW